LFTSSRRGTRFGSSVDLTFRYRYYDLNNKALVETDTKKRGEMYVRMQDLMEESGAYVFLTHEVAGVIYRDNVTPVLMPDGRVPVDAGHSQFT